MPILSNFLHRDSGEDGGIYDAEPAIDGRKDHRKSQRTPNPPIPAGLDIMSREKYKILFWLLSPNRGTKVSIQHRDLEKLRHPPSLQPRLLRSFYR